VLRSQIRELWGDIGVSKAWLKCYEPLDRALLDDAIGVLADSGIESSDGSHPESGLGLVLLGVLSTELIDWLERASRRTTVLAIALTETGLTVDQTWQLMNAGAADVILWRRVPSSAEDVLARIDRVHQVTAFMRSPAVQAHVVGESAIWRSVVRDLVEVGAFTDGSVLIEGESGTGKELLAQLVHELDVRPHKGHFIILDCAAITPELSGSEFFGHERGAFTGAVSVRDGAFALANGGTLFLDEVGELPLTLQAQLLRVVQEHQFKRVGSNTWQHTEFRLVCATNRDLLTCVADGRFRGDLYHRIAGWVCRVPPLRDRREDILPLTTHFLAQLNHGAVTVDHVVQEYLLTRDYPGNVRDLRQLVTRMWYRHAGPGAITPGDIPKIDRPSEQGTRNGWQDTHFERAIRYALDRGAGLKEISRAAAETAIRIALEQEDDNVHRAALRLGLTDRAVQLRRANNRQLT
jgi:transcriptional regulator with GAF, ATPase, and Fis domain